MSLYSNVDIKYWAPSKEYLIVDYYKLDKALDKIKEIIGTEIFDDTKLWVNMDDTLPEDITLKNIVILMNFIINAGNKFCQYKK